MLPSHLMNGIYVVEIKYSNFYGFDNPVDCLMHVCRNRSISRYDLLR